MHGLLIRGIKVHNVMNAQTTVSTTRKKVALFPLSIILLVLAVGLPLHSFAEEKNLKKKTSEHGLKALKLGAEAISHAAVASVGAIAVSGKAVSAVAAVPVAVSGKLARVTGKALEKGAVALDEAASDDDFSQPLPISDVSVTAGPPPDQAMAGDKE